MRSFMVLIGGTPCLPPPSQPQAVVSATGFVTENARGSRWLTTKVRCELRFNVLRGKGQQSPCGGIAGWEAGLGETGGKGLEGTRVTHMEAGFGF